MHKIVRPFCAVLVAPLLPVFGLEDLHEGEASVRVSETRQERQLVGANSVGTERDGLEERTFASYMSGP